MHPALRRRPLTLPCSDVTIVSKSLAFYVQLPNILQQPPSRRHGGSRTCVVDGDGVHGVYGTERAVAPFRGAAVVASDMVVGDRGGAGQGDAGTSLGEHDGE